ncbi:MAG: hypothetical protein LBE12_10160 [Planctomycetaceae bacterium]|nr:hypothetical protein [Planctomycetaceae bacterium]
MSQAELLPFGSNPLAALSTLHSPLSTLHYQLSTPTVRLILSRVVNR